MNRPYLRFTPQRGKPNTAKPIDEEVPLPTLTVVVDPPVGTEAPTTVVVDPSIGTEALTTVLTPFTAEGNVTTKELPRITVVVTLGNEGSEGFVRQAAIDRLLFYLGTGEIDEGCQFVGDHDGFPPEVLTEVTTQLFPAALKRFREPRD
jgi:hypothetical protein